MDGSDEWLSKNSMVSLEISDPRNQSQKYLLAPPLKPEIGKSERPKNRKTGAQRECFFVGDPVPEEEAQQRWLWRYNMKVIS